MADRRRRLHLSESKLPQVSIVIVNYNGGDLLQDCVGSIVKFTQSFEIILVDNASTDGSSQRLGELFPRVRIVRNDQNLGFAKANNIGLRQSRGRYVVLMNPDVFVTEDWLDRLASCMGKDPRIAVATPKLLRRDGILDSTGHVFRFIRLEARNRGEEEADHGQYDNLTELLSCDFACSIIRREVITQIGLLDDSIFLDHEDIDFCLRARIAGWRVVFCPYSIVYHRRGGSRPRAGSRTRQRRARRYMLRLSLKNYSLGSIWQVLLYKERELLSFLLDLLTSLRDRDMDRVRFNLDEASALFMAFFWNALHLPIAERVAVQAFRQIDDNQLRLISSLTVPSDALAYQ